ncbi:hypothetical protein [Burkholderia sp. Ac-20353]|uniref:hypothetical protein n=1 Tax=Burkholderia sp. Ac-20353 TaxID=2703894 RepID=UPI00197B69E9|nr:hypothetical protein [Burkholderia sp. Ac-20353]MBN3788860.1 hypothetical protein [Burkholderia sp. Ac-20353]
MNGNAWEGERIRGSSPQELTVDSTAFTHEASRLFNEEILPRWENSQNVWRNAWAMDTLLDYFSICGVDASPYAQVALDALNPQKAGNWWDDFGWIGIAALRAAQNNTFAQQREAFLKVAINAWAYMHGPGWSLANTAIYPFMDVPGWEDYAYAHTPNIGAPNVWNAIDDTWGTGTHDQKLRLRPRYLPGGAWNSPIKADSHPVPVVEADAGNGWFNYLNPVQNTVTNGLYAILTLRIWQASGNPAFATVFEQSGLRREACLQAWMDQIGWLDRWMTKTGDAKASLVLPTTQGCLVRERVSTFYPIDDAHWDAAYQQDLIWTGDQGLLLGALREAEAASVLSVKPAAFALYPRIVAGVFESCYKPRRYGGVIGRFLLPWLVVGKSDWANAQSPGSDDGDYETGPGVFMRYLLQAFKADPSLAQPFRQFIVDSATAFGSGAFGDPQPGGACDAYTPRPEQDEVDQMTAYVNRLSVLLLAIEMSAHGV